MAKYRKKPVVIEAEQFNPDKARWPGGVVQCEIDPDKPKDYRIQTLEGPFVVTPGDWIITGIKGETYPCKPDIFAATYDPVDP